MTTFEDAYEKLWPIRTSKEYRYKDSMFEFWQASRAATIAECAEAVEAECYCQDWDKEMCPYCSAVEIIHKLRG